MKIPPLLLAALVLFTAAASALAQSGPPPTGAIHRSLSALEAELLAIVDQKEQLLTATEKRNTEINQLTLERNRAQPADRDRLNQRIEANNNQNRIASIETGRLNLTSERIRIEIDRLMRFDDHLHETEKAAPKAPPIRAISVIKTERKGPVQIPGQGRGFHDITIYEVVFADGSRQRVESRNFVRQ